MLAVDEVKQKKLSLKKAAEQCDLKKSTLHDHTKKSMKNVDAPRDLSRGVEGRLAKIIDELAEWGHPIGKIENKLMVKDIFIPKTL